MVHTLSPELESFEPFPLLLLPINCVLLVLQCMPAMDRLRCRVNKEMNKLIMENKFNIKSLLIRPDDYSHLDFEHELSFFLRGKRHEYLNNLCKLTKNLKIRLLSFEFNHSSFHHPLPRPDPILFDLVKMISADFIEIGEGGAPHILHNITDQNVFDWARGRLSLMIFAWRISEQLTEFGLLDIYQRMASCEISLVQFKIDHCMLVAAANFLYSLGIQLEADYEDDDWHPIRGTTCFRSDRRDVQVFSVRGFTELQEGNDKDDYKFWCFSHPEYFYHILIGKSMRVSIRKTSIAMSDARQKNRDSREFSNTVELCIERFDSDGKASAEWEDKVAFSTSMHEMRTNKEKYDGLTMIYS